MRSKFDGYSATLEELQDGGWIKGSLQSQAGSACSVEALRCGFDVDKLPRSVAFEVCRQLWKYPSVYLGVLEALISLPLYRMTFKRLQRAWGQLTFLEVLIAAWNDVWWRRERTVLKVFERLAAKYENKRLRQELAEADRLIAEQRAQLEEFLCCSAASHGFPSTSLKALDSRLLDPPEDGSPALRRLLAPLER